MTRNGSRTRALLGAGLAVLVAGGVGVAVLPSASADDTGVEAVTTEAVFNDPTGAEADQNAIVTKIVGLIEGATEGSRVRMSMFYADDPAIPDALVAAHQRGVKVQAVFDDSEHKTGFDPMRTSVSGQDGAAPQDVYQALAAELGEDTSADSFVMTCPPGRGCVGTRKLSSVTAINHNKFFLFTDTSGTKNVLVQSSANLHLGRDGTKGWNNALVLTGHEDIYAAYDGYFDDQVATKGNDNYYDTRTPVTQDTAKIHFFPREESNGKPYNDPSEDTMQTLLDHVECTGNTTVGTPDDHRTIVRVNQGIFSRPYLAESLAQLDAAGCEVEVVATHSVGNDLAAQSLKAVLAKTDSEYGGVKVGYFCSDADPIWTHSKYITVEGKYYGEADRRLVWTGSANWSTNSLRQSDETTLQFADDGIVDAYVANFDAAFASTTHQPGNGDANECSA